MRTISAEMLHRPLAALSFVLCALVLVSFAMFATDQLAAHEQAPARGRPASTATHMGARAIVDRAATTITAPYEGFVDSRDRWLARVVPTVLALIVYGFGLGAVVRFLRR